MKASLKCRLFELGTGGKTKYHTPPAIFMKMR